MAKPHPCRPLITRASGTGGRGVWMLFLIVQLASSTRLLAASPADQQLDQLARGAFQWFQENRHPQTGQVLDRGSNWDGQGRRSGMSSIAATGYHLSLLPYWVQAGFMTREEAQRQALQTLHFAANRLAHHRGLFYHFVD